MRRVLLLVAQDLLIPDEAVCPPDVTVPTPSSIELALTTLLRKLESAQRESSPMQLHEQERRLVAEFTNTLRSAWQAAFSGSSLAPRLPGRGGRAESRPPGVAWQSRPGTVHAATAFALTRRQGAKVQQAVKEAMQAVKGLRSRGSSSSSAAAAQEDATNALHTALTATLALLDHAHLGDRALGMGGPADWSYDRRESTAAAAAAARAPTSGAMERAARLERELARQRFAFGQAMAAAEVREQGLRNELERMAGGLRAAGAAAGGSEGLSEKGELPTCPPPGMATVRDSSSSGGRLGYPTRMRALQEVTRRMLAREAHRREEDVQSAQREAARAKKEAAAAKQSADELEAKLARLDKEVDEGLAMLRRQHDRSVADVVASANATIRKERARRRLAAAGAGVLAARAKRAAEESAAREAAARESAEASATGMREALEEAELAMEELARAAEQREARAVAAAAREAANAAAAAAVTAIEEHAATLLDDADAAFAAAWKRAETQWECRAMRAKAAAGKREASLREAFKQAFASKMARQRAEHARRVAQAREQGMRDGMARLAASRTAYAGRGDQRTVAAGAEVLDVTPTEAKQRVWQEEAARAREEAVAECEARYLEELRRLRLRLLQQSVRHEERVAHLRSRIEQGGAAGGAASTKMPRAPTA